MRATQHAIRNGAGGAGGRGGIAHDPDRQQEAEHAKAYLQAAWNHPCACGSSKKYKLCCATAEEKALRNTWVPLWLPTAEEKALRNTWVPPLGWAVGYGL